MMTRNIVGAALIVAMGAAAAAEAQSYKQRPILTQGFSKVQLQSFVKNEHAANRIRARC